MVVFAGLFDGIAHVEQTHEVDQKRREPQHYFIPRNHRLRAHEADQPTRARPLSSPGKLPHVSPITEIRRTLQGPGDGEGVVGEYLEDEQDDGVLGEDEEEGEAEPQKLELLRIFAERNRLLVHNVQTAFADLVPLRSVGDGRQIDARIAKCASRKAERVARGASQTVLLCYFPVGPDFVEVQHVSGKNYKHQFSFTRTQQANLFFPAYNQPFFSFHTQIFHSSLDCLDSVLSLLVLRCIFCLFFCDSQCTVDYLNISIFFRLYLSFEKQSALAQMGQFWREVYMASHYSGQISGQKQNIHAFGLLD